jgi:hypothetical protein
MWIYIDMDILVGFYINVVIYLCIDDLISILLTGININR